MLRKALLGMALPGLILSACGSPVEPAAEERRIGLISGFHADDPRIVVPDTVELGASFVVEVTTYGDGCTRKGETEVSQAAETAVVTPYDYFNVGAEVCPSILLSFAHEAAVVFSQEGPAIVRIVGRDRTLEDPIAVEREVFVRPDGD